MSRAYIPAALRERVTAQARRRCGYCLTSEAVIGSPLEIDHILPESLGGRTEEDNLWLACSLCNDHKGHRIAALDPLTGQQVRLFDPRHQSWAEHFAWSDAGDRIGGRTAVGRATVVALNLNRPSLVQARRLWVAVGWHPPQD
jgi:hypothetical protein